jgi:tRNA pseudouridine38-40 synthase
MPRYRLTLEYDGGPFVGWQRQDSGLGVQAVLEDSIRNLCGEDALVYGAGRTDSGVHATGQIAHVDITKEFTADKLRDALNYHVRPHPVAVIDAQIVGEDFHARFSATKRAYLYRILNRRPQPVLDDGRVWWVAVSLDAKAMHDAAQSLVGHHDFTTFRATGCQSDSPVKTLDRLDVSRYSDEIHLIVEARSCLHHQVRNFAGSLKLVGEGKWRRRDLERALAAKDRAAGGPTAPPDGLYLTRVDYDAPAD